MTPRHPHLLLEDLAVIAARASAGDAVAAPVITLHLQTGRELYGRLVAVRRDRSESVVLLAQDGQDRFTTDEVHVLVTQVVAVTVHDASRLAQPTATEPAPGRLELRRAAEAMRTRLAATGATFTVELALAGDLADADATAIAAALPPLEEALGLLLADAMGKAALASITKLEIGAADAAEVTRTPSTLSVRAPRGFLERPTATGWRTELERAL